MASENPGALRPSVHPVSAVPIGADWYGLPKSSGASCSLDLIRPAAQHSWRPLRALIGPRTVKLQARHALQLANQQGMHQLTMPSANGPALLTPWEALNGVSMS